MGYSIFQNTMVDMTYPQIEEEIKKGACALLPISVVEEHGPHLCTGTDIYLTQAVCVKIKQQLNAMGKPVIIAPSFTGESTVLQTALSVHSLSAPKQWRPCFWIYWRI